MSCLPGLLRERATVPTPSPQPRRRLVAQRRRVELRDARGHDGCAVAPADGRATAARRPSPTPAASYLVYNFGSGYPAPMLNAGGNWYELTNGGHLMIIKAASSRLTPRLLVDSHTGYQARCERTPGPAPARAWAGVGDVHAAAGVAGARAADHRHQCELLRCSRTAGGFVEVDRMQLAAGRLRRQHPGPGPGQRRGDRDRRLRGQAGAVRRRRSVDRADDDDPSRGGAPFRRHAQGRPTTTTPPRR